MKFIVKNEGFLYEKEWVYDEEKNEGEYKTTFLNPERNNNLYLISCLNYEIELDEGFTVRDWFKLVINYPALQFLDEFMENYLCEYKKCPPENCVDPEGKVDSIVIKKIIELNKLDEKDENFDGEIFNDIYGHSADIHYGIDGWGLKNFLDIPLKITKGIFIRDKWNGKRGDDSKTEISSEDINITYTLFDLVKSFIFEISWFGTPEQRDERMKEMNETLQKLESGELKTIPYDLDELFKEKEEKNDT